MTSSRDITLGEWLAAALEAHGLSQARVAEALGVHQTTVSSWVRGRTDVSRGDLARLLTVLEVPGSDWHAVLLLPVMRCVESDSDDVTDGRA